MIHEIGAIDFRTATDVVAVRERIGRAAALLGVPPDARRSTAAAAGALARYAFQHAGGGRAVLRLKEEHGETDLVVCISGGGRALADLHHAAAELHNGDVRDGASPGVAATVSEKLHFIDDPGLGTTVELAQRIPLDDTGDLADRAARVARMLIEPRLGWDDSHSEAQDLRQSLVAALGELRSRQQEVQRLNEELEETNRGVLALYAELDDRAVDLARASEMKSRFLSSVSHELRTPLASLVNLSQLLLARTDGELTTEQEYQITLIRRSALGLMEMVNDLLDLARIEAGKSPLRITEVSAQEILAALRGMFRTVIAPGGPALVIEEVDPGLVLVTDGGKLSQVLRNFVSNAIKFTEQGEIRIAASVEDDASVRFSVSDTGIGIAPADHAAIFEAFAQVDGPQQRRVQGTGLGLSVSKRIAELLGGRISLESTIGVGSTFALVIPRVHPLAGSRKVGDEPPLVEDGESRPEAPRG